MKINIFPAITIAAAPSFLMEIIFTLISLQVINAVHNLFAIFTSLKFDLHNSADL